MSLELKGAFEGRSVGRGDVVPNYERHLHGEGHPSLLSIVFMRFIA